MTYHYLQISGPYRAKFVCFGCRWAFKWPAEQPRRMGEWNNVPEGTSRAWVIASAVHSGLDIEMEDRPRCPSCGEPSTPVGNSFRAPKKTAVAKWRALEKHFLG